MVNQTSGDGYYNVSAASTGLVLPYNGGPVIPNVQVVTIWWGSNVQYNSALEGFYNTVTKSSWQQIFAEYSTPSSTIGMGRWLQSYTYASAPTGTVWDSRIQSDLKTLLNNKLITQPNQNTYYAIHFAPGITIKIGSDASCSDFCAYHSSFSYGSYKVAYGVMPDPGGSCAGSCLQYVPTSPPKLKSKGSTNTNVGFPSRFQPCTGSSSSSSPISIAIFFQTKR
jgi:hypothetical protein